MVAEEGETVIRGIILVYDYLAQAFIDTGSTYSFIACTLSHMLELDVEVLTIPLRVTTLV